MEFQSTDTRIVVRSRDEAHHQHHCEDHQTERAYDEPELSADARNCRTSQRGGRGGANAGLNLRILGKGVVALHVVH